MSDEQKTDAQIIAESPFANPITVTRNGVEGTLDVFVGKRNDWKDLKNKPIDLPFGPYADHFSEMQHKYGPFGLMKAAQK